MAEEIAEERGGRSNGSILKKWGPLAAIVLLAQTVVAFAIIWFLFKDNVPGPQPEELIPEVTMPDRGGGEVERTTLPFMYSSAALKGMTANPAGTNAQRFIMFTVRLGLVGLDHDKNPPADITDKLGEETELLGRIGPYDDLIKSIIVKIVRMKTIDELDGENLHTVQEELKAQLNKEIFQKLYPIDEDNQKELQIQDVIFSDIIIQ